MIIRFFIAAAGSHYSTSVSGLYLGSYYVKEITPPTGYLADENEYDLSCDYEGDMTAEVKRECTSLEQVMKQPFQIIKAANNGKTDADLLKGAGFSAYLVSSLKVKEDGSYDFDSAKPVVIGDNGATEIFTDEKGYGVWNDYDLYALYQLWSVPWYKKRFLLL